MNRIVLTLILMCVWISQAWCAPPVGSVQLNSSALFQTEVKGKKITCGNLPPWLPGRIVQNHFYSNKAEISALKKKLKRSRSGGEKSKLQAKLAKLNKSYRAARQICAAGLPQPSATPTPSGGNAFFDGLGNVTSLGKMLFQIPIGLNANVTRGIAAWNTNCRGCHVGYPSALLLKNHPSIRNRIQLSPMSFSVPEEISDQQIADITAFANY